MQDILHDHLAQAWVVYREKEFNTPFEVAWHQISTAEPHFLRATVTEIIDAGMLQEAANDRGDVIVSLSPGMPGRKQQMPRTCRSIFTPA